MQKKALKEGLDKAMGLKAANRIDIRTVLVLVMTVGTITLLCLLLDAMLRQPFEPNDDLIWFTKLRRQSFSDLPLSAAWMLSSPFYRPVAESFLKCLYLIFGMELAAYRAAQFVCFLLLIAFGSVAIRQLRLPFEATLALVSFCLGSPFLFGSVMWISELPHILIVICFAASLTVILSSLGDTSKLALCALAFAIAVLSKENGLALAVFYFYFLRSSPFRAGLVFGSITAGYLLLRGVVLGPSLGAGGVNESVGYFLDYLTQDEKQAIFPGGAIYKLYLYNIAAQIAALLFRLTQWGIVLPKVSYQGLLHSASTTLIALALAARMRRRDVPAWLVILILTIVGGTLFSYSYARDRHLALPAFAYGMLLVTCCSDIGLRMRSASVSTALIFFLWAGWSALAYRNIAASPASSLEVVEKSYRPYSDVQNPQVAPDIWQSARRQALELTDR